MCDLLRTACLNKFNNFFVKFDLIQYVKMQVFDDTCLMLQPI